MRAALFARVSTDQQTVESQLIQLREWAERLGHEVVTEFELDGISAYKPNGELDKEIGKMLLAAHQRMFDVLLVWAADRLTRKGAEDLLRTLRLFRESGVRVRSLQEPWLDNDGQIGDVLVAFAGWVAQQESKRRSERMKIWAAGRKARGEHVGRPKGASDRRKSTKRSVAMRGNKNASKKSA